MRFLTYRSSRPHESHVPFSEVAFYGILWSLNHPEITLSSRIRLDSHRWALRRTACSLFWWISYFIVYPLRNRLVFVEDGHSELFSMHESTRVVILSVESSRPLHINGCRWAERACTICSLVSSHDFPLVRVVPTSPSCGFGLYLYSWEQAHSSIVMLEYCCLFIVVL